MFTTQKWRNDKYRYRCRRFNSNSSSR